MKNNYLHEFRNAIDYDLDSTGWSASIARNVYRRHRYRMVGNVSVVIVLLGLLGAAWGLIFQPHNTAYNQFYTYISESDYDYDILDLRE